MLKYHHGAGGYADDSDTMQRVVGINSSHIAYRDSCIVSTNIPGSWGRAPNQKTTTAEGASLKYRVAAILLPSDRYGLSLL